MIMDNVLITSFFGWVCSLKLNEATCAIDPCLGTKVLCCVRTYVLYQSMGQSDSNANSLDPQEIYNALNTCDVDSIRRWLQNKNIANELKKPIADSTRLAIEVVIYSNAPSARIIETLQLLIDKGMDVNYKNPESYHPPFSLIAIHSPPDVVKFLLDKGMDFSGECIYPAEEWCNLCVAHLIHRTPEPCSKNTFAQTDYPADYNHNKTKLKIDAFNYIEDEETRKKFVRLMETRSIKKFEYTRGEYPVTNIDFEFPRINGDDTKTVTVQVEYNTRMENNGSEKFNLRVTLIDPETKESTVFQSTHNVNAYDGNSGRPHQHCEGDSAMAQKINEYFGLATEDLYAFLLLLMFHMDQQPGLVTSGTRRVGALVQIPVIQSVPRPSWLEKVAIAWGHGEFEKPRNRDDDYDE